MGTNIHRHFLLAFRSYIVSQSRTQAQAHTHTIRAQAASTARLQTPHLRALHTSSRRLQQRESLAPQTHYEFFPETLSRGPPPHGPFAIDLKALRKEFYQLQAKAHPDLFPAEQKARAEGLSARINEAYKSLQDPLRRAQYLLSLKGIDVAEDETAKVEDPELLMEVLEMREAIEAVQDEGELEPMKARNDGLIERSVAVLDAAFKQDDVARAKEEAVRLRYWTNIKESLDAWEKGKPVVLVH